MWKFMRWIHRVTYTPGTGFISWKGRTNWEGRVRKSRAIPLEHHISLKTHVLEFTWMWKVIRWIYRVTYTPGTGLISWKGRANWGSRVVNSRAIPLEHHISLKTQVLAFSWMWKINDMNTSRYVHICILRNVMTQCCRVNNHHMLMSMSRRCTYKSMFLITWTIM